LRQPARGADEQARRTEHGGAQQAKGGGDGEENDDLAKGVGGRVAAVLAAGGCSVVVSVRV